VHAVLQFAQMLIYISSSEGLSNSRELEHGKQAAART